MSTLTELFRNAVSEGSDTGVLITADACDESDNPTDNKLGTVLRRWIDIQTYVRMSQPIPLEMADEFKALNDSFGSAEKRRVEGSFGTVYSKPVGPYYTALEVHLESLAANPELLSVEPIRELTIMYATTNDNLGMLFRNYRMDYMWRVSVNFDRYYNANRVGRHDPVKMAQIILGMQGSQLQSITLNGIDDRLKKIHVMFNTNGKIRRGCELRIARQTYNTAERVAVHK